ncbi:transmembrane protein 130 isoform X1 [Myotis myotis]|uniref:transmembrane protein 130 isoform X1 n=1 Tax=Myotis myotis TaxID=51298 RepID=UPI00174D5D14|nr:transmembrane protein 130 isoform X1 [Myotis myotis]
MAPTLWLRVSHILRLVCLLHLAPAVVAAGLYELHLVTDSPATTGAEVNITASLVASDNGSLALPTDPLSYRFHWVHSPLLLKGKTEEAFRSTIRAVGNVPGDFPISVWVTSADCQMCQPVARSRLVLSITENIVGKLVITQNASLPWPSTYFTKTLLKTSFLLHDPSNFFKTASFLYSWDFGDGTQMVTEDSTVYYNRSIMGTFTVKLKVVAEWEQAALAAGKGIVQKTGHFSGSLKLQETLRGIQVMGPTEIQAFQEMTVTLNFLGSPPLTMCWRIKSECLPLEEHECRPVPVAGTVYNVTTIIMDPGDYCFSIRAENVISRTHQYHRVQVWPSRIQPAVFAFPCATIITMMLAFIMYMTLRNTTQQKDMVEVADFDFSPMSDKNPEPPTEAKCCQMCCVPFLLETPSEYLEVVRENHGLLPPLYKSVKTYTV